MQFDDVNIILSEWIHRLNLNHWEVTLIVDEELDNPHSLAEVSVNTPYNEADIQLDPGLWKDWSRQKVERTILHELLHLHFEDVKTAAEISRSAFSDDSWYLYRTRLNHEIEAAVEALAVAIYRQTLGDK